MNIIELASFKLEDTINEVDFLDISTDFQKNFVEQQPGFIQRKLIRKEDTWCDLVVWENMTFAEAVSKAMGNNESAKKYGACIKAGTVTVEHYEVFQ